MASKRVELMGGGRCVFVLPGVQSLPWEALPENSDSELLITRSVADALAFRADRWALVMPHRWEPLTDPILETARVRDLARVLAVAADSSASPVITSGNAIMPEADLNSVFEPGSSRRVQACALPSALAPYLSGRPAKGDVCQLNFNYFNFGKGIVAFSGGTVRMDLTGRSRPLVWGPHVSLPSGIWKLRVTFSLLNFPSRASLRFEWGHMSLFEAHDLTFDKPGRYELELTAQWDQPDLSEMRVLLPGGAFSGEIILERCAVERG
mgnify:CR=1 FL=1